MYVASREDDKDIVDLLLSKGADINQANKVCHQISSITKLKTVYVSLNSATEVLLL